MDNYFSVGLAIVERLEQTGLFKKVAFLQSLNNVTENKQITPACYVVYRGDVVTDDAGQGKQNAISQRYSVVVAVANAQSQTDALAMVKDGGELIPKVLKELKGWQPSIGGHPVKFARPLVRTSGDMAGLSNAFSYYPFTFESKVFI